MEKDGMLVAEDGLALLEGVSSSTVHAAIWLRYLVAIALFAGYASATVTPFHGLITEASPLHGLVITSMSLPQQPLDINSQLSASFTIVNTGQLAAENASINLLISGPTGLNESYPIEPLAPGQTENVTVTIRNVTVTNGTFNVVAKVNYNSVAQSLPTNFSTNAATGRYNVSQARMPLYDLPQLIDQPVGIPNLQVSDIPILEPVYSGSSRTYSIALKNTGTSPEIANLSVPEKFSEVVKLSANTIYLQQGSTIYSTLLFNQYGNMPANDYVVPLNIIVTPIGGSPSSFTEQFVVSIGNPPAVPTTDLRAILVNDSTVQATLEINNPTNLTINNAAYGLLIPKPRGVNSSTLKYTGIAQNVTSIGRFYQLLWPAGQLFPQQIAAAQYFISNSSAYLPLANTTRLLMMLSPLSRTQILTIENPSAPTLSTNSSGVINISAIYTGPSQTPQQVSFTLSGPKGITIVNPQQNVSVLPNQQMKQGFVIRTGTQSGTFGLTLYVSTNGANYTYDLPLVVVPGLTGPPNGVNGHNGSTTPVFYPWYFPIIMLIILTIVVLAYLRKKKEAATYDEDRVERMMRIKKSL
ncbi:MAG: hypothetical protein KGH72_02855 [Candidatus Micrarchaeota archaeon]|nr:hypothetical protein [Candidatus Micrarchaeota archaeon]